VTSHLGGDGKNDNLFYSVVEIERLSRGWQDWQKGDWTERPEQREGKRGNMREYRLVLQGREWRGLDRVKGVGRAPPPSASWAEIASRLNARKKVAISSLRVGTL
jgi:hypothetical protein